MNEQQRWRVTDRPRHYSKLRFHDSLESHAIHFTTDHLHLHHTHDSNSPHTIRTMNLALQFQPSNNLLFPIPSFHRHHSRRKKLNRHHRSCKLTITSSLIEDSFRHLVPQFPYSLTTTDFIGPVLGFASVAGVFLTRLKSKLEESYEELDVGKWSLFISPTTFNRFVVLRCPSLSLEGNEMLEDVNERLLTDDTHSGRIVQVRNVEEWSEIEYQRVCVGTEDGGVISLDWPASLDLSQERGLDTTVVIVPGTTEGSLEKSVRSFVVECLKCGCFPIVMNPRGCAGSPLTTARLFTAADSDDVCTAIKFINSARPWSTLVAVGWRYGANMLVKYLAEVGEKTPLSAATCIENPFDLSWATSSSSPYHYAIGHRLTDGLIDILQSNKELFAGRAKNIDVEKGLLAKSVREFDEAISMVSNGFHCLEDFYHESSTYDVVGDLKIPVLFIQTDDGTEPTFYVPHNMIDENPYTSLLICSSQSSSISGEIPIISWCQRCSIEWLMAVELGLLKGRHPLLQDVDVSINPPNSLSRMVGRPSDKAGQSNTSLELATPNILNEYNVDPTINMLKEGNTAGTRQMSGQHSLSSTEIKADGSHQPNSGTVQQTNQTLETGEDDAVADESSQVLQTAELVMKMLDVTMPGTLAEEQKKKVLKAVGQGDTLMKALQDVVPEDVRGNLTTSVSSIISSQGKNLKIGLPHISNPQNVSSNVKSDTSEGAGGVSNEEGGPNYPSNNNKRDDTQGDQSEKMQPATGVESEPHTKEKSQSSSEALSESSNGNNEVSGVSSSENVNSNENGVEPGSKEEHKGVEDGKNIQCSEKGTSDSTEQKTSSSTNMEESQSSQGSSSEDILPVNDNQEKEEKVLPTVPNQNISVSSDSNPPPTFNVSQALDAFAGMDDTTQVAVTNVFGVLENMITQFEAENDNQNEPHDKNKVSGMNTESPPEAPTTTNEHNMETGKDNVDESRSQPAMFQNSPDNQIDQQAINTVVEDTSDDSQNGLHDTNKVLEMNRKSPSEAPTTTSEHGLETRTVNVDASSSQPTMSRSSRDNQIEPKARNTGVEDTGDNQNEAHDANKVPGMNRKFPSDAPATANKHNLETREDNLDESSSQPAMSQNSSDNQIEQQAINTGVEDRSGDNHNVAQYTNKVYGMNRKSPSEPPTVANKHNLEKREGSVDESSSQPVMTRNSSENQIEPQARNTVVEDRSDDTNYSDANKISNSSIGKELNKTNEGRIGERVSAESSYIHDHVKRALVYLGEEKGGEIYSNAEFQKYPLSKSRTSKTPDKDTTNALLLDYILEEKQGKLLAHPRDTGGSKHDTVSEPPQMISDAAKQPRKKASSEILPRMYENGPIKDYELQNMSLLAKTAILESLKIEVGRRFSAVEIKEMEYDLAIDFEQIANAVSLAIRHGRDHNYSNIEETSGVSALPLDHIVDAISHALHETTCLKTVLPLGLIVGSCLATLRKVHILTTVDDTVKSEEPMKLDKVENAVLEADGQVQETEASDIYDAKEDEKPSSAITTEKEKSPSNYLNNDNVMAGAVTAALGASTMFAYQQGSSNGMETAATSSMSGNGTFTQGNANERVEEAVHDENRSNMVTSLAEKAMSIASPVVPTNESGQVDQDRVVSVLAELGQQGGILRLVGKLALLWAGIRGAMSLTYKLILFFRIAERPLYQRLLAFPVLALLLWSPVVIPLLPTLMQGWATHSTSIFTEIACIIGLYVAIMILIMVWGNKVRGYDNPLEQYGLDFASSSKILNFAKAFIGGSILVFSIQTIHALLGCVSLSWPSSLPTPWFKAYGKMLLLVGQCTATATAIALVEELFFRSWLPAEIESDIGYYRAIILSGLAFSLLQRSLQAIPGLWLLSLGLAGARRRSQGSLSIPIGLRAGIMTVSFALQKSGILTYHSNTPFWITGAHPFQPFSGIVGLTFSLMLAVALYPRPEPLLSK